MKAILIDDFRHLHWTDVPTPAPAPDEILIRVACAGVNRADLMQRAGDYPPPPGAPEWMGLEVSGTVTELGAEAARLSSFRVGDRVCALLGGGGYAEFVTVRWDHAMPVPAGCSMEEAAALPEAFATSYLNLFTEGGMKAGDTVLIQAGASGLAGVMIPMAKAFGARVITTIHSEPKRASVAKTGADVIVNTATESLEDVLRAEEAAGHPVCLAVDCLGGENMGKCLSYLARGARWIMIAALAGQTTEIDLKTVYVRNIRIIGSTLRSRAPEVKAQILSSLVRDVWPRVTAGRIRPTIFATLPITEAEDAHAILSEGRHVGKVVLKVETGKNTRKA